MTIIHDTDHVLAALFNNGKDSTLGDLPAIRWWNFGRRHATPGVELTYRQLASEIERTSAGLIASGLRAGDRVLFSIRPRPAGIVLALAIVRAGGSIVFVDPGSTPELFSARVAAAAPRFAATESVLYALGRWPLRGIARRRGLLLPDYGKLDVHHFFEGPRLPGVPRGAVSLRKLKKVGSRESAATGASSEGSTDKDVSVELPALDANREVLVVFTSGTTSDPRAVVHTGKTLQAASEMFAEIFTVDVGESVHTEQMLLGLPALQNGATWSLPAAGPDSKLHQFAVGLHGSSGTYFVPLDLHRFLNAVEAGQLPARGPRVGIIGGGPVPAQLLRRAKALVPTTHWRGVYGMTEMLPVAVADLTDKEADLELGDVVGKPLPGISARLSDEPIGELIISGPSLMLGYLNKGPATEQHTGDLARIGPNGQIILVGRTKDMLIRGKTNIYPGLFESRLTQIAGVRDAAMVGLPTDYGDEQIVLAIQPEAWEAKTPAGPKLAVSTDHPALTSVRAQIPHIIDHDALPDIVVAIKEFPVSGRASKLDRQKLSRQIALGLGES